MENVTHQQDRAAAFRRDMERLFKTAEDARNLQSKGQFGEAVRLLRPNINALDSLFDQGLLKETDNYKYYSFDSLYERMLHWFYARPKKEMRRAPYDFGWLYFTFGNMLVDVQNFYGARVALKTAMEWNPTCAQYALEYAETYKSTKDFDKYFELIKDIFRIAYRPTDLAHCFRGLGYYFAEKKLWDAAIGCLTVGYFYDRSEHGLFVVNKEMDYICHMTGKRMRLGWHNIEKHSKKYGFPCGPNEDVVNLARYQGEERFKEKDYDTAKYLLLIADNLRPNDEIKVLLGKIEAHFLEQNKTPILN